MKKNESIEMLSNNYRKKVIKFINDMHRDPIVLEKP